MFLASEDWDDAALTALVAGATLLGADLKIGLYTNILSPAKNRVIGDFTEPTYASYARQALVMGVPFRDLNAGISSVGASILWQQTGTPTPCLIQGYFLTFGAGPAYLGMEALGTPFQMTDDLDAFRIVFEFVQNNRQQGFATLIV